MNRQTIEAALFKPRSWQWTAAAFGAIVAVGFADYVSGPEITFSVFYLVPVAFAAWISGTRAAALGSLLAAVLWLSAELASRRVDANLFVYTWNFGARLLFLLLVALLLARLRAMIDHERETGRTDVLTGLVNARGCYEMAEVELARAHRERKPVSLAFIDIDDFKHINDTRGHAVGDALLVHVAAVIKSNLRASDFVARYGGDEFVVLLPLTDQEAARVVIGKIAQRVTDATSHEFGSRTLSIGVVTWLPGEARPALRTVLAEADRVMYEVKMSGKAGARYAVCGNSASDPPK